MSYAQPSDFLARFDARVLGDLVGDTGVRETPSQLLTDANLQAALDDASGLVNTACLVGERYTAAELSALTGVDKAILIRLNCNLAFIYMAIRRGVKPSIYDELHRETDEMLERLRTGQRIFNVLGDVATGVPAEDFPSAVGWQTVNILRSATYDRLFPVRRQQSTASD